MTFAARLRPAAAGCLLASAVAVAAVGPAGAQQKNESLRNSYLALIDDSCRGYRVALAFPRSEHDKIKAAVKADGGEAYANVVSEFELNTRVAGAAGACEAAFRKAYIAGADATMLVPDKQFLSKQSVTMLQTAQLQTVQELCKRLTVDTAAVKAEMEKYGLDGNETRVKKYVQRLAGDERVKHKRNPAPFCLDMYGKWSAAGVVKTRD
ncbi:MAG: hypothetical protein K2Y27_26160 [Xanthobacteraceae bacterium]|nr:hypothetical protein [Xanthobacteraceae bacterium]